MGLHRTMPDGHCIHRLPSPPLQSPHRGQLQVLDPPINLFPWQTPSRHAGGSRGRNLP